jgi:hypothetical protein
MKIKYLMVILPNDSCAGIKDEFNHVIDISPLKRPTKE